MSTLEEVLVTSNAHEKHKFIPSSQAQSTEEQACGCRVSNDIPYIDGRVY